MIIIRKQIEEIAGDETDPVKINALLDAENEKINKLVAERYQQQRKEDIEVGEIVSKLNVYMDRLNRKNRKPLGSPKDKPKRSSAPEREE